MFTNPASGNGSKKKSKGNKPIKEASILVKFANLP